MEPKPAKEPSQSEKFRAFAQKVISVPKAEIERRESEHQKQLAKKRESKG